MGAPSAWKPTQVMDVKKKVKLGWLLSLMAPVSFFISHLHLEANYYLPTLWASPQTQLRQERLCLVWMGWCPIPSRLCCVPFSGFSQAFYRHRGPRGRWELFAFDVQGDTELTSFTCFLTRISNYNNPKVGD